MTHRIPSEAAAAAARGELIEAIKLTRQATGLGLKEAKELVDRHVRARGEGWDDEDEDEVDAASASGRASAAPARSAAPVARAPGLAPGEVPRGKLPLGLLVAVIAGAVAVYLFVR